MKNFQDNDHILNHGDELVLDVSNMQSRIRLMSKVDPLDDNYFQTAIISNNNFDLLSQITDIGIYSIPISGIFDFYIDTIKPCEIYGKIIKYKDDKPQILSSFKYMNTGSGVYTGAIAGLAVAGLAIVGTE